VKNLEECRREIDAIDRELIRLFEERMQVAEQVAAYKLEHGLPVLDAKREEEVVKSRVGLLSSPTYAPLCEQFVRHTMKLSRTRQKSLMESHSCDPKILSVTYEGGEYDILLGRGILQKVAEHLPLGRKVLVVTDSGVPSAYAQKVAESCLDPTLVTLPMGEATKSLASLEHLLSVMLQKGFTRSDCVVAVGGGVVGDLSGFAASAYMRGIDFYNIPTTLLSQLDSSIGGKVAVDFLGVKNIVGAFYPPKKVLIDPDVLKTLDRRQFSAGLAEAIKMAATCDADLFQLIEQSEDIEKDIDRIILGGISVKRCVVEQDPKEAGLRRVLNFGHTVGHAIESMGEGKWLHGECVAMGMLTMCSEKVANRLKPLLQKYNLPTEIPQEKEKLLALMRHDKKAKGKTVTVVYCPEIGSFSFLETKDTELSSYLEKTV